MVVQFRSYADDPAPAEPALDEARLEEQDHGNIVAFEHINLEVPDLEVGRLFYSEVLRLTPDPLRTGAQRGGVDVTWYNVGRQQLHIAKGPSAHTLPPGATIGLVLPHVDVIPQQAAALRPTLGELPVTILSSEALRITDPYGVTFEVRKAVPGFGAELGIAFVRLPCFVGTSALIGRFYSQTLGAPVKLRGHPEPGAVVPPSGPSCTFEPDPDDPPSPLALSDRVLPPAVVPRSPRAVGRPGGPRPARAHALLDVETLVRAHVQLGVPGTELVFYEDPALGPWSTQRALALYSGWHMCFYVSQFSPCYLRLRTLIYNAHRYRDKVRSFHDALDHKQFRFQDVVLVPDGLTPAPMMLESSLAGALARVGVTSGPGGDASMSDGGDRPSAPTDVSSALVRKSPLDIEPITALVSTGQDEAGNGDGSLPTVVGSLLYRIGHEVRSLRHHNFLRPLINRGLGAGSFY